MLLLEWFAWWNEIIPLQADEQLTAYQVNLLSDSGWKTDRESIIQVWNQLARRDKAAGRFVAEGTGDGEVDAVEALRRDALRVRDWLKINMSGID
jgi:hypothetical protein